MSNDFTPPDGASTKAKGGGGALGLSIAGMVIGGLAMLLSFVPCFGAYAFWPGLLATALSFFGLLNSDSKTLPIIGLCVSLVAVGMGYYWMNLVEKAVDKTEEELKKLADELKKKVDEENAKLKKMAE